MEGSHSTSTPGYFVLVWLSGRGRGRDCGGKGGNEMHAIVCTQVGIAKGNEFVLTFDRFWHDFE